ncbi:MAG: hypothetical protein IPJ87_13790 [Flavobacteriales bacterium]|nr:hypothetical protein [Flavobacteriales bacterium]MBK7942923.1 hypothetical protein [Flavobacteriales bacterium]MBK8948981.1 hypothetical protein [Flavobacteriales bacterium]MBK9698677.1 hypothetical protein [Flavobacteriales bacterium]
MRALFIFLAFTLGPSLFAQPEPCTATLDNIRDLIGEVVVFCGTPDQVTAPKGVKGAPVYFNFGGRYPEHRFSVVIWEDVHMGTEGKILGRYQGKPLRIRGWVKEHEGRPVIELKELKDLRVQ